MAQRRKKTIDKGEIRIVDDMNVIFSRVIRLMSDIQRGADASTQQRIHPYVCIFQANACPSAIGSRQGALVYFHL